MDDIQNEVRSLLQKIGEDPEREDPERDTAVTRATGIPLG